MSVKISGDFAQLNKWAKQIAAAPKVLAKASAHMAEEALDLVREGFENERAPSGSKWAPLKSRKGKILQDTARLKNSFHRRAVSKNGFTIATGVKYASAHQKGVPSRNLPARPMTPSSGRLPDRWLKQLLETASEVLSDHFDK